MATGGTKAPIWGALDGAAQEYADAKQLFDEARLSFEVAKKKLEVTKQLAADFMAPHEWATWLENHSAIRYAGASLGDAVTEYVTKDTLRYLRDVDEEHFDSRTVYSLENLRQELTRGGFEFRTLAPLRELNAGLINLAGIEKTGEYYGAANTEELRDQIKREREE